MSHYPTAVEHKATLVAASPARNFDLASNSRHPERQLTPTSELVGCETLLSARNTTSIAVLYRPGFATIVFLILKPLSRTFL